MTAQTDEENLFYQLHSKLHPIFSLELSLLVKLLEIISVNYDMMFYYHCFLTAI